MIEYENLGLLNKPYFEEYKKCFNEILKSGRYVLGKQVELFERNFASYCEVQECVGVASGLDAIRLCLEVFKFKPGSEVIVPSNTYIATILAVIHSGLTPILVEPELATYNLDPNKVESAITSKTVAIIAVHMYGKLCKMDALSAIASAYGLKLIEDCAQAHGGMLNNKKAGSFGHCNAFSFYPTKNLGALGDAGAVTTDDKSLANSIRALRNYGSTKKYYNDAIGFNSRLDELQAGFLNVKLEHLDEINLHKRRLADVYLNFLTDEVIKPLQIDGYYDVYHIFNIRHGKRDQLKEYLDQIGIKTEIHYPIAPSKQRAMQGKLSNYNYPIANEIHATTLSLPISRFHSKYDIEFVAEAINKFTSLA